MIVDQTDTPLFLGPIHRSLLGVRMAAFESAALALGTQVTALSRSEAVKALAGDTVVATDGERWSTVRLSPELDQTPVEWLHDALLPQLSPNPKVAYHHDLENTLARIGNQGVGVLLPSPDFAQVLSIVGSGRLLPEKATSFQPKPSIGVLMRPVGEA